MSAWDTEGVKLHALLLLGAALGLTSALAQAAPTSIPAPLPSPPAQAAPAPLPSPVAPPLSIAFSEILPTAVSGQKVYEPHLELLDLGQTRSDTLRAGGKLTLSLRQDVTRFALAQERAPQNARFEFAPISGEWRLMLRPGIKVDLEATLQAVEAALRDPAARRVNVVYSAQAPQRTLDFFLEKGITGLLGEGVTHYAGSSSARTANIHVGAAHFQELLVEDDVFSFNDTVGPVTAARGFLPGLVISGDRTASGVGGGICQVSSTVFRSLFAAGLPVRERQNHSYQVHYYDPQGLDATIYQPNLDLKFDNDTGSPLWFQTDWDDQETRLTVRVFGRPRAETVEVGQPRVLATQPPPPPRFVTDPALAPGARVQIDWAAPGATIEVERSFLRGGQVVRREVLRSVYRPWPNIFRVGPDAKSPAAR